MADANGWIIVCPQGQEEADWATGDSVLYIEHTERKTRKDGSENLPARPTSGSVRGTVACGWFDGGDIHSFASQPWYRHRHRIGRVEVLDPWRPDDGALLFDGLGHCREFDITRIDTSACTSFEGMFRGCTSVVQLMDLDRFDTSNLRDVSSMFMNCLALRVASIAGWDVSRIERHDHMLYGCPAYVLAEDSQEGFLGQIVPSSAMQGVWRRAIP